MSGSRQRSKPDPNQTALLIFKLAAACGLSWELASLAGSKHPYLAPISVILCMQATASQAVRFSLYRIAGTVIGVCATVWAARWLPLNGWTLALLALLCGWVTSLLKWKPAVIQQAVFSVVLVFELGQKSGQYPLDRIRDTVIGVAVGVLFQLLVPPNMAKQAKRTFEPLSGGLSAQFQAVADWVERGCGAAERQRLEREIRSRQEQLFQAGKELEQAADSLKINLWAGKSRALVAECRDRLHRLKRGYAYLDGLLPTFEHWAASGTMVPDDRTRWAAQLRAIGVYWSRLPMPDSAGAQPYAVPVPPLQVSLPGEWTPHRYPVSAYAVTEAFLQRMRQ